MQKMQNKEVMRILNNTPLCQFSSWPPIKPLSGEVYLYKQPKKDHCGTIGDFVCDLYSWISTGKHASKDSAVTRYFQRKVGKELIPFYKRCISIDREDLSVTLMHYYGKDVERAEAPHGNRKHNLDKPHLRTMPSVLNEISISKKKPGHMYKELLNKSVPKKSRAVALPRNMKQCENKLYNDKINNEIIDKCDISSLIELSNELDNFVTDLKLLPTLSVTIYNDLLIKQVEKLIKEHDKVILSYDTTYNLGDFLRLHSYMSSSYIQK